MASAHSTAPAVPKTRHDQPAKSGLSALSKILSTSAPPASTKVDRKQVPGHIANILKVILLHDKFEHNFSKWSLVQSDDRDVLVLTLKHGAVVDSSLVYTICMMYPFRIHGPILIKNTMHVEFLHDNPLEIVGITGNFVEKNVEYQLGTHMHTRKRQRPSSSLDHDDKTQGSSSSADTCTPDLVVVREKLSAALHLTNSTRVLVEHVDTGLDAGGLWANFRLSECDKLNLDFIGGFQLAVDDVHIKVCVLPYVLCCCTFLCLTLGPHSPYKCRFLLRFQCMCDSTLRPSDALHQAGSLYRCIHKRLLRPSQRCVPFANTSDTRSTTFTHKKLYFLL